MVKTPKSIDQVKFALMVDELYKLMSAMGRLIKMMIDQNILSTNIICSNKKTSITELNADPNESLQNLVLVEIELGIHNCNGANNYQVLDGREIKGTW